MSTTGTSKSAGSSAVTVGGGAGRDAAEPSTEPSAEPNAESCADGGPWDPFQWDAREDCDVRQILDRIADKWSLLVISLLADRTMRFTELRREIDGISQRMLTVTLRHLERDGLVCRTVHAVVPPRVDYCLSPLGHTLLGTIQSLVRWTEEHQAEIARARAEFDAAAADPPTR